MNRPGVLRVLRRARKLVARPYGWTKKRSARYSTRTDDGLAYCATGAIDRAAKVLRGPRNDARITLEETFQKWRESDVVKATGGSSVVTFNDHKATKKQDVLALFDKAIEAVERGEIG